MLQWKLQYLLIVFGCDSSGQNGCTDRRLVIGGHVIDMPSHVIQNRSHLSSGFASGKDSFWKTGSFGSSMIQIGKGLESFVWRRLETMLGLIDG